MMWLQTNEYPQQLKYILLDRCPHVQFRQRRGLACLVTVGHSKLLNALVLSSTNQQLDYSLATLT